MPPVLLELFVLALGIVMLVLESFAETRDRKVFAIIGIVGLALVFLFLQVSAPGPSGMVSYVMDWPAIFFKKVSVLTTIVVLIMSIDYADTITRFLPGRSPQSGLGEFFALPVLTCAGMMWMSSAIDFILIFVSLELVTISFYVLVAFMRRNAASLEAGVKYLILSALSTGFTVYGITWIYGVTQQTNLTQIQQVLPSVPLDNQPGLLFGALLVLVGLGFKIAAAPFQFWVPDVYQGAPTPITAFLSVGSKAVGFIVLLRVVLSFQSLPAVGDRLISAITFLAAVTLIYGNLAALPQTNFKRLLAYSSVGHAGYLLIAVAAIGARDSGLAVVVYLAAYLLMTLLSFLILVIVSTHSQGDDIVHFNGLGKRSPFLAFGLLVAMMSLAGVPLTAGFLGKFLVFKVAFETRQFFLIALGILTVGCGFYFYLKVVKAMYWQPAPPNVTAIPISRLSLVAMWVMVVLIFALGIFPQFATGLLPSTSP
ncbi:MAG: NADH-quinone oxidoreductase subunit N [Verrucomicrobia bacterium]|nr:NADH-quinone oxidoreductase subunit N [Verrucomicrobiota bacterium]MBV8375973.1 NADH-quinone oxidoreductase subunit N [Verrucomicrobiota bacterium]